MLIKKSIVFLFSFLFVTFFANAQIEVDHVSLKGFQRTGFGAFLNFSVPVSDADYATAEAGLLYFQDNNQQYIGLVPMLAGYRYTINRSGTGFYIEPNAGYTYGGTTVQQRDKSGNWMVDANGSEVDEKVSGLTTGVNVGYLFEQIGIIQFNIALRYEHSFGPTGANIVGLRISHAITFGRRNRD